MDIINALQQGDQVVFEEVYHQYHERVYFYVWQKTQSAYIAEEATQLTFVKLWQYRAALTAEQQLFTQIFRIARTTMIDLLRKQYNSRNLVQQQPAQATAANDVWQQLAGKEIQASLLAAIEQMPPVRKQVFILSRLQGLSHQEIAGRLSISVKTVEGHITLALKDLRKYLPALIVLGAAFWLY
ncbi:RNA polymerase sigma-70 factor [Deminuibacter soli]|uniref:RNA polymerase sigma-70 factor n=1 Tax=Deminuibacter soli TaxID=2291815 RepID=UPI0013142349|nr:RNA polymerase sigma-70 factor [Deminuibacter soli]